MQGFLALAETKLMRSAMKSIETTHFMILWPHFARLFDEILIGPLGVITI